MDWDGSDPLRFLKMMNGENLGAPGHLSMPEVMEPAKVRKLCKARSSAIMANHDRPRCILDRHERSIHKRWTKKTKQRRLQILLDGWPDMPTMRRPDFAVLRRESRPSVMPAPSSAAISSGPTSTRKTCSDPRACC